MRSATTMRNVTEFGLSALLLSFAVAIQMPSFAADNGLSGYDEAADISELALHENERMHFALIHSQVSNKADLWENYASELLAFSEADYARLKPQVLDKSIVELQDAVAADQFDYADLLTWISPKLSTYAWIIFIPIVVFIVIAVSNGANLTDGIDGLAAGSSAIMVIALGIFAWVSGNLIFSKYLNIMYIPNVGEVVVFIAAFMGSLIGFLWYNTYPASVFVGDTGSLTIGAIIAVIAIIVRKELLIPLLCGIFLIENVSVIMQVGYFKYTKKKTGIGRRIFKMSPLHHHYQKLGYHESKIVARFWIIGILLAVLSIVTLKIR